jgi:hypothetical protein
MQHYTQNITCTRSSTSFYGFVLRNVLPKLVGAVTGFFAKGHHELKTRGIVNGEPHSRELKFQHGQSHLYREQRRKKKTFDDDSRLR